MIATLSTMVPPSPTYTGGRREIVRLLGAFRDEAQREVAAVFGDVSGKKIDAVGLPGFGRRGVSRALHGCESNALFRIAGLFLLMKRLGMGRERALRWIEWLRQMVDVVWPPEEVPPIKEALEREQEADGRDDTIQLRAYAGDRAAMLEWAEVKVEEVAVIQEAVRVVRYHAAQT